jgi:DNA processing protein
MLDLHVAAALSALPGTLGSHLLAAARARRPSPPAGLTQVAVPVDFDLEAELAALFEKGEAISRAAAARVRGNRALDAALRGGLAAVPFGSPTYPPLLMQIADAPPMLWMAGAVEVASRPAVAIVGSRAASPLSLEVAGELGRQLAEHLVVVSGLARGVDAAAHRGALETGTTLAVLGCGADVVYPAEHRTLSDAIAAAGALIAEGVPGTPPRRDHFPRRNRLISGLSLGVVVVEASARSGSLITARLALDQGREVMAVPGPVTGERHRGAHALIRDGGALVESAADVFAVLGIDQSVIPGACRDVSRASGPADARSHEPRRNL